MKNLCRPVFLLFFLPLLFTGCQKGAKVERTTENGVEVVINHLEPYKLLGVPSSLTLSEVFSIDTEKEALAAKGLLSISSLALDSAGNIFIGQRPKGGNAIFKFDTHGNFVSSFGREGQGPGEFQSAPGILFDDEDHLIAQDASTQGVIVFDKDGKFLQIVKGQRDVSPDRLLKTKRYLVEWQVQDVEKGVLRNYYAQADKALKDIRELHHFEWDDPGRAPRYSAARGGFALTASAWNIYLGDSDRGYEILVFDLDGKLVRKIRKEYRPVPVPEQYKALVKKLMESRGERGQQMLAKMYWPPSLSPFRYFFADDQGRLYVMTPEREGERTYIYDIFTKGGVFVGRMRLDNVQINYYQGQRYSIYTLPVEVRGDQLYCIREKDSGFKVLTVYKMTWN